MNDRKKVVIIGGGFAGLWAVRRLRRAPVDITLIDRSNHHLFQPLLYQVATAGSRRAVDRRAAASHPAQAAQCHRAHGRGAATSTPATRRVTFGERSHRLRLPAARERRDACLLRSRRLGAVRARPQDSRRCASRSGAACSIRSNAPKPRRSDAERDACLTFAVIGGGPTGVELAGTLAEIARHTLARRISPHRLAQGARAA